MPTALELVTPYVDLLHMPFEVLKILPRAVTSALALRSTERFWTLVGICEHGRDCVDCCWPWLGSRHTRSGHGQFLYSENGEQHGIGTHRLAYELEYGRLLPGFFACHDCPGGDNPACCNPHHLKPGTPADNGADSAFKGRRPKGAQWHIFHPPETYEGIAKKLAADHPERFLRGEANKLSKLTSEKVQTILALECSLSAASTGRLFRMSCPGILAIWKRRTWAHVAKVPIDSSILTALIHQAKLLDPPRGVRGEQHYMHKLTDAKALTIFSMKGIKPAKTIAQEENISRKLVEAIWQKKIWKHIHVEQPAS